MSVTPEQARIAQLEAELEDALRTAAAIVHAAGDRVVVWPAHMHARLELSRLDSPVDKSSTFTTRIGPPKVCR